MTVILVLVIVVILLGGFGYSQNPDYGPHLGGGLGLLLLILLILFLTGHLGGGHGRL